MKRVPILAVAVVGLVALFSAESKEQTTLPQKSTDVRSDETVTDFDGNTYKTVKIGNQVWMAENLRSTHYADGSPISYFIYDNDPGKAKTYGLLYSSGAVMHGAASSNSNPSRVQGIAPRGWHVPSVAEWQQLADALGGLDVAGGKLKEKGTAHWMSPNVGATDESRFSALPAGMHDFTEIFQWFGDHAVFATSKANPERQGVAAVMLQSAAAVMIIGNFHPDDAYSVRCVKDE